MKVYNESLELRGGHVDQRGFWRPSAILDVMQEAAGSHASILGIGANDLIEKDVVWILTRTEVEMITMPRLYDKVTLETFPTAPRRFFCPRYYVFKNEAGEEIGHASTLWALLDFEKRAMVSPAIAAEHFPDTKSLPLPMGMPATAGEVSAEPQAGCYVPVYTDMDVNNHVNNIHYIDWACNALGFDTMREKTLKHFIINYSREIREGQQIATELRQDGDHFSFSGLHEGSRHFDIEGWLA